jgi:hypothetical protein
VKAHHGTLARDIYADVPDVALENIRESGTDLADPVKGPIRFWVLRVVDCKDNASGSTGAQEG